MVATGGMLDRSGVIQYVGENAAKYGLDPAAVLSVANHEGLNTAPGSTWNLSGEGGFNFGPPSWYTGAGAAGATILGQHGQSSASWSWTPAGLDYWLQQVSAAASGLSGTAAIAAIVHKFERPKESLAAGEITNASNDYQSFVQAIGNLGTQPGTTVIPDLAPSASPTVTPNTNAHTDVPTTGMNLGFSDSIGHITTQFLLVLLGIALLVGGIYLIGSRG